MNTSQLKKIERPMHSWATRINFDTNPLKSDGVGALLAFAGCVDVLVPLATRDDLGIATTIILFALLLAGLIVFGRLFVDFVIGMASAIFSIYHEVRVNIDEQRFIDFGTMASYYDPETRKEYSEAEYRKMLRDEQKDSQCI